MTPLVRSASLINYANLAREAGLDPLAMLAQAGLPPEALDNPDIKIPALQVRALMEASASRSGWQDFGLRLAETRQFWVLGPLAMAVREQPSLRPALTMLMRHMRLHNESLNLWLEEDERAVTVHLEPTGGGPTRQSMELSLGMLLRFLQRALPAGWQPLSVCLTHGPPADLRTARRVLGPRVEYGALFNGFVVRARDLDLPMTSYTRLDEYTREYVRSLTSSLRQSSADQVRQLALALLPTGQCSLTRIAEHMGAQVRTVNRRLAGEGTGYADLLNQLRRELAQRHLSGPPRKQSEIALMLGFSGPTVFSRWFRQQFGQAPLVWAVERASAQPSENERG